MTFLVAWRLWLLAGVAALVGAWVLTVLRRRRDVIRFTNVALLDVIAPRRPAWRRHVPPALFLAALTMLVVGFARPARATRVPEERATVMLAIDTSLSMDATDVNPSRLAVAQQAALDFVDQLPAGIELGLVSFNGTATVAVSPTDDRTPVRTAIVDLDLGRATAIGEAIFASLEAIEHAPGGPNGEPPPGRIVLMSDGEWTSGRPNEEGAAAAAAAHVPVYTIAFGTTDGTIDVDGREVTVPVAPGPLEDIANATGGRAYEAATLPQLTDVYDDIGSVVGYRTEDRDVSGWFTGAGLALLAVAATASLLWSQRLP